MIQTVGAGWERLSRVPPCVHFGRWHKPNGPRVMWVQEYPPVGCKNSSNCHALSYEHVYRLSALVVESRLWAMVRLRVCGLVMLELCWSDSGVGSDMRWFGVVMVRVCGCGSDTVWWFGHDDRVDTGYNLIHLLVTFIYVQLVV